MYTVVLGDIHGRDCWKEIIAQETKADKIVFLGDYISTHDGIPEQDQIDNLQEILEFKQSNLDKVILLRGNHDLAALYNWAECTPYVGTRVIDFMLKNKELFLNLTQWVYVLDNNLFSHAGISEVWLKDQEISLINPDGKEDITVLNAYGPSRKFGFVPGDDLFDTYGTSPTQSCTWIRPWTLIKCMYKPEQYVQIVGHSTVKCITTAQGGDEKHVIYMCDCLPKEYLVVDDNIYKVKQYAKNK